MTVAEWFEHWTTQVAGRRVRPRTLDSYRSIVRLHVVPTLGHVPLQSLEPEDLEALYAQLLGGGLSPSTVLRVHRVVSRALKVAEQRKRVERNVAALVDGPRQNPSTVARPLTVEEARRVLVAARPERNAARWSVALALGLRQSEALALRWGDVDLAEAKLTVARSVHRVTGRGFVYEETKTRGSRRTISLPGELVTALGVHVARQNAERVAAGEAWQESDLVFAQPDGRPIDKGVDYDAWCRLLTVAGVAHARLHDARHTAATLLLAEGVHARVVMDILGHSQMRTTTDTYGHVLPAAGRDAADRMNTLLLSPADDATSRAAEPPVDRGLSEGSSS